MRKNPLCSIIVLTFNNIELTRLCLEAVKENTPINHELIIIDNASSDGTVEFLRKRKARNTTTIFNRANEGFAKGANRGALSSRGKYLVFLNNDAIPQKKWLEEMVEAAERYERVGAVGSRLLYPDGTLQHAGVGFGDAHFTIHFYKGEKSDYPPANEPGTRQAVTGACLLTPRNLFLNVGMFDQQYVNGFEDIDFCFKVRQAGYRVLYWPKSTLVHFESMSPGRKKFDARNMAIFRKKWAGRHFPDTPYGAARNPAALKALLYDARLVESGLAWNPAEVPEQAFACFYDALIALALSPFFSPPAG